MKNSLLLFNDGKENFFAEYLSSITRLFKRAGFEFSTVEILSPSDDLAFKNTFSRLMLRSDNLVVVGEGVDFDLKNIVAEATNSTLLENENAKSFLDAVRKSSGIDFSDDNALIPLEATVIPNLEGAYQGFMLDNQEFTLAVLPSDLKQFLLSADKYFIPFLEEKYSLNRKRMTLKYVGSEKKLIEVLEEAKLMSDQNFEYQIEENFGDYKIDLTFDKKGSIDNCPSVRYVIEKLGSDIYAEYDVSLSERLFDVLKLKNLTLSVAESFTGG